MIRQLLALLSSVLPFSPWAFPGGDAVLWTGSVEIPDGTTLEFSVELEQHSGTITIPVQHVKDLPLSDVSVTDKELRFSIASAGAVWELKVADDGKSASGVLRQGAVLRTTMKRLEPGQEAPELARPQEPQPPFPYETLDVTFASQAAGVELAGTLSLPRGSGPFPCAVLVSGSGPQDRDEALAGHRPFLVIADHLTRHGIAVLRYDDRGVGRSTGTFDGATTEDFAQDAMAAVAFLKARADVDAESIGIVGHSEGALVAPICAARSEVVAFIVLLAGPGMRGAELLPLQSKLIALAQGMPTADAELMASESAAIYALMLAEKSDAELRQAIRAAILRQLAVAPQTKGLSADEITRQAEPLVAAQTEELLAPCPLEGLLILESGRVPAEDIGFVRRFLERHGGWRLVVVGE